MTPSTNLGQPILAAAGFQPALAGWRGVSLMARNVRPRFAA